MTNLPEPLARVLIDLAPQGIAVCNALEPDYHVIYVNPAMERLTGYSAADFLGRNMRFLQGDDREQEGLARIRNALAAGEPCHAMLRNYRHDGSQFWNEIMLEPIRDGSGRVTHVVSFHRDGSERSRQVGRIDGSTNPGGAVLREDKLTSLLGRPHFEELLRRDWSLAQRESRRIALIIFDLDEFRLYQDVFGRAGADQTVRRVARAIGACFRRSSDLCGRFDDDQIVALANGMTTEQAGSYAETVIGRIHELAIHHPRSTVSRFVTVSAGVVTMVPPRDASPQSLIDATLTALDEAKKAGGNRVVARDG